MNRKERFSPPTTGGISLLVVFAVLCLTVFALMSLTTVQADSRLTDASLQAVENYYAAEGEALGILARLLDGEVPEGVVLDQDVYAYTCPVSKNQELKVEVEIDGKDYAILRWQVVSVRQEKEAENVKLWDGTPQF